MRDAFDKVSAAIVEALAATAHSSDGQFDSFTAADGKGGIIPGYLDIARPVPSTWSNNQSTTSSSSQLNHAIYAGSSLIPSDASPHQPDSVRQDSTSFSFGDSNHVSSYPKSQPEPTESKADGYGGMEVQDDVWQTIQGILYGQSTADFGGVGDFDADQFFSNLQPPPSDSGI